LELPVSTFCTELLDASLPTERPPSSKIVSCI
jgi:hypothetical protein